MLPNQSTESLYILDRLPINLNDVLVNATVWHSGDPLSTGGYLIRVNDEGVKDTIGYLFATNPGGDGSGDIGLVGGPGSGGSFTADGTELSDKAQSYAPTEWTLMAFSANAPDPNDTDVSTGYYKFYTHPSVAYQVFLMKLVLMLVVLLQPLHLQILNSPSPIQRGFGKLRAWRCGATR